jgi:hypothetical protein
MRTSVARVMLKFAGICKEAGALEDECKKLFAWARPQLPPMSESECSPYYT